MAETSSADVLAHFTKVKAALEQGQSQVEGLLQFFKERISFEETRARSLDKLSKHGMSIDEKATEPTMFEALASLKGDIANESVQHSEFAASIGRDVLEPLVRLKEGGETVMKLANQVKAATKDLKNAHERCRKGYTKYIQLHGRATQACGAAGMTVPDLWIPSGDSSLLPLSATGAAAIPTTPSLQGAAGSALGPTSPAKPPLLYSASARILPVSSSTAPQSNSSGLPPRRHSSTAPGFESPVGRAAGLGRSGGPATVTNSAPREANYTDSPTPTTFFSSPPPLPGSMTPVPNADVPVSAPAPTPFDFASTPRVSPPGALEDGTTLMHKLDLGASAVPSSSKEGISASLAIRQPAATSSSAGEAAAGTTTNPFDESFTSVVTVDLDNAAHVEENIRSPVPTADELAAGNREMMRKGSDTDSFESQPPSAADAGNEQADLVSASQPPPALRNPEGSPSANSTTSQVSGAPGTPGGFSATGVHNGIAHTAEAQTSTSGAGASATPGDAHSRVAYPLSANLGATSQPGPDSDLTSMTGRALKSVASGIAVGFAALLPHVPPAGNPHAPNMIVGTANMTTAELIELRRSAAVASLQAVDEACSECKEAWGAHGRAREKFNAQVASALVIFREIEKKRVAEISDCLRRYTVFVSSLHANLQYDVQRLSAVVEAMGEAPATTTAAVAAFTAPVPSDDRLEFARIDQGLINSIASQASASGASGTSGAVNGTSGGPGSRRNSGTGLDAVVRRTSFSSTNDGLMSPDGGLVRATSKMFGSLSGIGAALGGAFSHSTAAGGSSTPDTVGHMPGEQLEEGGPEGAMTSSVRQAAAPTVTAAVASETHPAIGLTVTYADPPTPEPAAIRRNSGGSLQTAGPLSSTSSSSSSQNSTSSLANMGKYFGLRGFGASSSSAAAPAASSAGIAASGTRTTHRPLQSSPLATKSAPTGAPPSGRRSSLQNSPGNGAPLASSSSPGQTHAHPSGSAKGMSVSVSVMGSVRHPNAGAAGMGTRETAAMLEHLHLQPGPVEHLVEALFDPSGAKVTLGPDGTLMLLAEAPAAGDVMGSSSSSHGDLTGVHGQDTAGGDAVPQISLDDFTSGKTSVASISGSGHTSPVGGRSRGGTAASAGIGMTSSGSSSNVAGLSGEGSRPGSPAEGRPRAVSVIPLAEASFGALASGGVSSPGEEGTGAPVLTHAPGKARRASLAATAALSTGSQQAALNPAVPILLPKVCNSLRSEPEALSRLVMALDARRTEGSALSRPSFDALCAILMSALDGATTRQDYPRARSLMVISQTFYCYVKGDEDPEVIDTRVAGALYEAGLQSSLPNNSPIASSYAFASLTGPAAVDAAAQRPKRVYAQSRVRFHSLWQSGQYWESAVYETIGMELAKNGLGPGMGAAGAHGHAAGQNGHSTGGIHLGFNLRLGGKDGKKAEAEAAAREAELTFGQLGFFAYTMIAFGLPEDSVRKLLDKYTRALKLDESKAAHLGGTVAAFAAESRQTAQAEAARIAKLRAAMQ